jgi:hypothetical protein
MNYVEATGTSRKSNADQSFRTLIDEGFAPELARSTLTKLEIFVKGVKLRRPCVNVTEKMDRDRACFRRGADMRRFDDLTGVAS